MNDNYYKGDPLEGTRWENLSFDEYYNMTDDERKELREHLESINAPFGSDIIDEANPEDNYKTWRDIVTMSEEELKDYWNCVKARYTFEIGRNPLEGTPWENLTIFDYVMEMSEVERKELFCYLERIQAPYGSNKDDGIDRWSWRDIVTLPLETVKYRVNNPSYVYNKELGLYEFVYNFDTEMIPF